ILRRCNDTRFASAGFARRFFCCRQDGGRGSTMARNDEYTPDGRADAGRLTETPAPADPAAMRAALAARIQRVAEREMDAVERVLDALGPSDHAEADRCARTLAGIARTLREITALNTPDTMKSAHDTDDDTIPVDLDALRCELARRIIALVDA